MSEDLMPCPICDGPVVLDGPSNPDASRDVVWPNCIDDSCPYMLDGGIRAAVAEAHNTLARRAEIGALVEWIVEAAPGLLTIGRTAMTDGVTIYSAWSSKPFTDERSLLDALRALAKEVGCE